MSTHTLPPFHLAIPVTDLQQACDFYGELLGCEQGRSDTHWIDWNFFGHQLVTHQVDSMPTAIKPNEVDSKAVPVPHFGAVLPMEQWKAITGRLKNARVAFVIEPYIRFEGQAGEQATCFFYDPSGNALELKSFNDINALFKG